MLDILVIENGRNVAKMAKIVLARHGWDVAFHRKGQDCLEVIREVRPRLVILDLTSSGRAGAREDGVDILSELRRDGDLSLALTPVVMLTGGKNQRVEAIHADAVLPRPFAGRDLCAVVNRMLPGGVVERRA